MAIWHRKPKPGLIHHSDRGSQHASQAFRKLLKAHGIQGSMSRRGNCWECEACLGCNAVAESFFGSLKQERVQWTYYQTRLEAQQDVLDYITMFYNSQRLHSYLGHVSPNAYEKQSLEINECGLTGVSKKL
jgi:transposase InsO family protein